jgi:hydroxymethylglutaryl-CoA lyase
MQTLIWPRRVTIREVGLRDGLQSIARTLPTAQKLQWIQGAYDAGVREIEVGSFVPPKLLPQLADTAELVAFAKTLPGLVISVLVPNLKGAERAMDSGADWMLLPLSASHAHSLANLRKAPDDVVAEIAAMVEARCARGSAIRIEVGMSTALGCTIQGRVEVDEVLRLLQAVTALGVDRVGLADTVGYADPRQVGELFARAREVVGDKLACGHFHDTRGLGMANVSPALVAVRMPRGPAATWPPKTWPTFLPAWASKLASTSISSWLCAPRWRSGWQANVCTARSRRRVCPRPCALRK